MRDGFAISAGVLLQAAAVRSERALRRHIGEGETAKESQLSQLRLVPAEHLPRADIAWRQRAEIKEEVERSGSAEVSAVALSETELRVSVSGECQKYFILLRIA